MGAIHRNNQQRLRPHEEERIMKHELSRRQFFGTTALGSMLLAGQLGANPMMAAQAEGWPAMPPVKIHKVYVGRTGGIY